MMDIYHAICRKTIAKPKLNQITAILKLGGSKGRDCSDQADIY